MLISLLIKKMTDIFMQNEKGLLDGTLKKALIDYLPEDEKQLSKIIDKYSYPYIYNQRAVVEIEIAGYNVIGNLLKEFFDAVINPASSKSKKLLQLISQQFIITGEKNKLYFDIQSIVDYIAGDDRLVCSRYVPENNGDVVSANWIELAKELPNLIPKISKRSFFTHSPFCRSIFYRPFNKPDGIFRYFDTGYITVFKTTTAGVKIAGIHPSKEWLI